MALPSGGCCFFNSHNKMLCAQLLNQPSSLNVAPIGSDLDATWMLSFPVFLGISKLPILGLISSPSSVPTGQETVWGGTWCSPHPSLAPQPLAGQGTTLKGLLTGCLLRKQVSQDPQKQHLAVTPSDDWLCGHRGC